MHITEPTIVVSSAAIHSRTHNQYVLYLCGQTNIHTIKCEETKIILLSNVQKFNVRKGFLGNPK
jgi:hypothetical protein